jgi:hypothetical protein
MRCLSCDRKLSDRESTRKYASSGTFVDLCNRCFSDVAEDIPDIDGTGIDLVDDFEEEQGHDESLVRYDWNGAESNESNTD